MSRPIYSKTGGVTILGLLRDLDPSSATREAPPSRPEGIDLKLPQPYHVYDIRSHRALGLTARVKVQLEPAAPVMLALSDQSLPGLSISGPSSAHVGQDADFRFSPEAELANTNDVIHIEITDPDGNVVPYYSGNRLAPAGALAELLPLAVNDKAGTWTVRATNLPLEGQQRVLAGRALRSGS